MNYDIIKGVALRFLRAFLSGSLAAYVTISPFADSTIISLQGGKITLVSSELMKVAIAILFGGVTAVIMSADKALRAYKQKIAEESEPIL